MDVCLLNQEGEILLHRNMNARPETVLKAIAPYREEMVVAVEGIFTWSWLADLWAHEGSPFVLGHALSRQAIHGGKANHEKIDAQKIAVLLRGGRLPQADVSPAAMRATRDLLRRRMYLMRRRAALLTHLQPTPSQYNRPEIGKNIADKANREGGAARFPDPAGQNSIAVDLELIGHDDPLRRDMELAILNPTKQHDAHTLYLRRTVPGIGELLSLVLVDESHNSHRFPRVQEFLSSCRLVKGAKASAGKRFGTSGAKIGHAYLTGACSEAAVLFLRDPPVAQPYLARVEKRQGKGQAFTVLAQQVARAVYALLTREVAFDTQKFCHGEGRGAGEPGASLDYPRISLRPALCNS
jgi:transposase